MVCEGLQELEWNFIQARAGACLDGILDHKQEGHQGEHCPED
jgi:hypothetical protein